MLVQIQPSSQLPLKLKEKSTRLVCGGMPVRCRSAALRRRGQVVWPRASIPKTRVRFLSPAFWTDASRLPLDGSRGADPLSRSWSGPSGKADGRNPSRGRFDPDSLLAPVAQWTERPPSKQLCVGSIPTRSDCTRRPTDRARGYGPRNGSSILSECDLSDTLCCATLLAMQADPRGDCEVCGAPDSPSKCLLGPVSGFWCDPCENERRIAYRYLVKRMAWLLPRFPEAFDRSASPMRSFVGPTTKFYGKTEDQFWSDVERVREWLVNNF